MEVNSSFPIELKYLHVAFNNPSLPIPQKTLQFTTFFCNLVRFYITNFPMCLAAMGKRENIHSPMDIQLTSLIQRLRTCCNSIIIYSEVNTAVPNPTLERSRNYELDIKAESQMNK